MQQNSEQNAAKKSVFNLDSPLFHQQDGDNYVDIAPQGFIPPCNETSRSKKLLFRFKDSSMESSSPRPVLSYNELIIEAINSSPQGMLSLQEIYDYIQNSYSYFKSTTVAWQNSIRHNLSVQKVFERVNRPVDRPGKGGLWRLAPMYEIETREISRKVTKKRVPSLRKRTKKTDCFNLDSVGTCVNSPFPKSFQPPNLMDTLASIALSAESSGDWHETPSAESFYEEEPSGTTFVGIELSSPIETQYSPSIAHSNFLEQTLLQATKDTK